MIFQTAGSNATQIIKDIEALLEDVSKDFPPGVEYSILLSANDFLYASIHEVLKTLIEAFILVFLVARLPVYVDSRHSDSGCFDRYVLCALPDRVQHELANTLRPRAGYRNRGR